MSTVIKAGAAGRIMQRLSTVDLEDYLAEARSVVESARRQAAQMLADADGEAERVAAEAKQAAYREGHAQGYAEGVEDGRREAYAQAMRRFEQEQGSLVTALKGAIAGIEATKEDLRIASERDVLEFAVWLAEKLTFAVGRLHRDSAVENLRRALRLIESKTDVTIRVHPDDVRVAGAFATGLLEQADASRTVHLVHDDSFAPGGCKVECGPMCVDATLETQVDQIVALLTGRGAADD
jgi:flagellar assembly protein FliH